MLDTKINKKCNTVSTCTLETKPHLTLLATFGSTTGFISRKYPQEGIDQLRNHVIIFIYVKISLSQGKWKTSGDTITIDGVLQSISHKINLKTPHQLYICMCKAAVTPQSGRIGVSRGLVR